MKYTISTEKSLLSIDFIHTYMTEVSYWGSDRSIEQTEGTIKNSLCFGMYNEQNNQIGFGRIVTDFVFFGNIMDVFISPEYQGQGLGKSLVSFMLNHDLIKDLQTITLKTKDAHSLYEKYGFKRVGNSELYMSRDRQKLD